MTSALQLLRTGVLTIAWLFVLPAALLLFSAIVPILPWIRIYAFDIVPNHAPWLTVLSLGTLAAGMVAHARQATHATRGLIAIGALATLMAGGVTARLIHVAHANAAKIAFFETFSFRSFSDDAAPDETRIYARPEGEPLRLDIYHPPRGTTDGPSPVMVFVHGGGFVEGSRSVGAANARYRANHGWTVISVDYRLARADRPTWNLAIHDVRCALAWVGTHAKSLNVDLNRLTLSGASAGASLAMAAAYTADAARRDQCGARMPRVAAVYAKVPLIDPVASWNNPGELQGLQRSYMTAYLGGSPDQYPERYAAVDLRRMIRAGNPPTLILAGADDPLLPAASVEDFADQAKRAGTPVRLVMFPFSGHDFNTSFHGIPNQAVQQIVRRFMKEQAVVTLRGTAMAEAGPAPAPVPRPPAHD